MSNLIGDVLGVGGIGSAAQALLDDIGKLIPDTNLRAKLETAVKARQQEFQQQLVQKAYEQAQQQNVQEFELLKVQGELNKAEAASQSFFIGGWRPFLAWSMIGTLLAIIWTCLLLYVCGGRGDFAAFNPFLQIVLGILLPLAGLRTLDKGLGVAPSCKTVPPRATPAAAGPGDRLGK
jgi:hypothetical protein